MKEKEKHRICLGDNYGKTILDGSEKFRKNISFDKKRYLKKKGVNDEGLFKQK